MNTIKSIKAMQVLDSRGNPTVQVKVILADGTIGKSIEFPHSPLTIDSCKSIINALKNYADTDYKLQYKLTLKNTVWEALNSAEAPPSGNTWQEYVQSLGWLYG